MKHNQITKARAFGVLAALAFGAGLSGGACSSTVPSDQGSASSSVSGSGGGKAASTTAASTTASSGGTGGMGGASTTASTGSGTGATGTGGAPSDCSTNPMTYLEIINACTNAQQVDLMPVLPLLEADGGLPPLP